MDQNQGRIKESMLKKVNRDVGTFNEGFIEKSIKERQNKIGIELVEEYIKILESDDQEALLLNHELNNTTSQFFREELTFSLLKYTVLPHIMVEHNGKKEIRVWSAGCAKGQEPYSIAILMETLEQKMNHRIPYRIFATDISEVAINSAKIGIYESSAVQNVKLKYINQYFNQIHEAYVLKDQIKNKVSFSLLDLCDQSLKYPIESIYGGFDLIFCCNVLIYYQPKQQKEIIEKLIQALAINGFLVLGETERLLMSKYVQLKHLGLNTAIYQVKERKKNET